MQSPYKFSPLIKAKSFDSFPVPYYSQQSGKSSIKKQASMKVHPKFSFLYISHKTKLIETLRKRRYLVRSLCLYDEKNQILSFQMSSQLSKCLFNQGIRKSFKLLKYLEIEANTQLGYEKLFELGKLASAIRLKITSSCAKFAKETLLNLKYHLNSNTKALSVVNKETQELNSRAIYAFFRTAKLKSIKDLHYTQEKDFYNWFPTHRDEVKRLMFLVCTTISEMRWLESVILNPINNFFAEGISIQKALSKLPNLTETAIRCSFVHENRWMQALGEKFAKNAYHKYFLEFINLENLKNVLFEVDSHSSNLLFRLMENGKAIENFKIHFVRPAYRNKSLIPADVDIIWSNIGKLENLKNLSIRNMELVSNDDENICFLSTTPLNKLRNLLRFTYETNPQVKAEFIEFKRLGDALGAMTQLEYLKIHSYMSLDSLLDFFESESCVLDNLKEIDFNFQLSGEIRIESSFKDWFWAKMHKLKSLQFKIGTYNGVEFENPYFTNYSLSNICQTIQLLENLRDLKLCFGCAEAFMYSQDSQSFSGTQESNITLISTMLRNLQNLNRVVLQIGAGYLCDLEVKKILTELKKHPNLTLIAFGGDYQHISNWMLGEHMDFLQEVKKFYTNKYLMINMKGYMKANKKEIKDFNKMLADYYQDCSTLSIEDVEL